MRKLFAISSILGVGTIVWLGVSPRNLPGETSQATSSQPRAAEKQDRLVVHEWGTFTSFSGSDGVRLEFRPLADDDLPDFVIHRGRQAGAVQEFVKAQQWVRERMETPVTYFYTDREREVQVKVEFPQGLLTEFYPPVARMLPEFERDKAPKLRNSELDWKTVQLIPTEKLRTSVTDSRLDAVLQERLLGALLPGANGGHYGFARETDSALVHVNFPVDPNRPHAPYGHFFEKFLFYRGIGNFDLPIRVEAHPGGRFEVRNNGPDPIRSLFLVTANGESLRMTTAEQMDPNSQLTMVQSELTTTMDQLVESVVKALVAEHLFEKEARAMVNTWRQSWFGESGTRLFYILPSRLTGTLLPLTISPTPDELIRVLVGRYEIMSPEDEGRVAGLVEESIRGRAAFALRAKSDEKLREAGYPLPESIQGLGRLAEPALVRVKTIAREPAVRREAAALLVAWAARKREG